MADKQYACTFVTAFIDLPKLEGTPRRCTEHYLNAFKFMAAWDHPIVIYIEEHNVDDVRKICEKYSPEGAPREYRIVTFDDLPMKARYDEVDAIPPHNVRAGFSTYYYCLVLSKIWFLYDCANNNPFNTDRFCWSDFGLAHISDRLHVDVDHVVETMSTKVRFCLMRVPHDLINASTAQLFKTDYGIVAAGVISGGVDAINQLYGEYFELIDEMLASKARCFEEQLYACLVARSFRDKDDKYDYMVGDYWNCLTHGKYITTMVDHIIRLHLIPCMRYGYYTLGTQIAKQFIDSVCRPKGLTLMPDQFCKIMWNGYIISYYHDREFSERIADIIIASLQSPKMVAEYEKFGVSLEFITKNLSYVNRDPQNPRYTLRDMDDHESVYLTYYIV